MQISVRLGPSLSQVAGAARLQVQVPESATVADLLNLLGNTYTDLAPSLPTTAVVIAGNVVTHDTLLIPGEEVSILQPISGGNFISL